MSAFSEFWTWITTGEHWSGTHGIPNRVLEHVELSALSVLIGVIVALPIGLYIGHTRRAEFITVTIANLGRAVPSFAIVALMLPVSIWAGLGLGFWPTLVALVFLAIPPIIVNTYVGVREVDPDTVESAVGMGMSGKQVLRGIEIPLAAPLIVGGIRTAAVSVVATATLSALIGGGTLGRFIRDGFASGDHGEILGGAILVALLAILTEVGLSLIEKRVTPGRAAHDRIRGYEQLAQAPRPGEAAPL